MEMKNMLLWFMTFFFISGTGCSNIETQQVSSGNREERGLYSSFAGPVEREGDDHSRRSSRHSEQTDDSGFNYSWAEAIENGDVVWSHKEIHHLNQLDDFVANLNLSSNGNRNIREEIRIVTASKEGELIVKDLIYDGEAIHVAINGLQAPAKFSDIVVEKRFSDHYEGYFTEYFLVSKSNGDKVGDRELVLQIHPGLQ